MEPAPTCLVLPHERLDGPDNMARDEAMLEQAAAEGHAALVRTYEWTRPTLSLGYFQSIRDAKADPRWRDVAIVRRATGGGAILHDREVTFALAIPAGHPLARRSGPLYRSVHEALTRILKGMGAAASRRGDPDEPRPGDRPFLCFLDRDPEDLVLDASKVVGSAQRRRAGAVLQHGSVLLGRSPHTPELPGLTDLIGATVAPEALAATLQVDLPRALGFEARPVPWPPSLLSRAETLTLDVYGSDEWTYRR